MPTFTSKEVIVNRSAKDFFIKIGDLNNLKEIMPSSIEDFENPETTCSFKMKGMPVLNLKLVEKIPFSKISLTAQNSKVPFHLDCFITEKGEHCQARLEINAELNMMMKMMVEKPLTQFLDILSSKMKQF